MSLLPFPEVVGTKVVTSTLGQSGPTEYVVCKPETRLRLSRAMGGFAYASLNCDQSWARHPMLFHLGQGANSRSWGVGMSTWKQIGPLVAVLTVG